VLRKIGLMLGCLVAAWAAVSTVLPDSTLCNACFAAPEESPDKALLRTGSISAWLIAHFVSVFVSAAGAVSSAGLLMLIGGTPAGEGQMQAGTLVVTDLTLLTPVFEAATGKHLCHDASADPKQATQHTDLSD